MVNTDKIFEEAFDVISDGKEEISEEKKVVFDKKTGQVSIKIPKGLALKKGLNEKTIFEIVYNPKEESIERARKAGFILFTKEDDNGKEGKRT
jgi:hypothetical protein